MTLDSTAMPALRLKLASTGRDPSFGEGKPPILAMTLLDTIRQILDQAEDLASEGQHPSAILATAQDLGEELCPALCAALPGLLPALQELTASSGPERIPPTALKVLLGKLGHARAQLVAAQRQVSFGAGFASEERDTPPLILPDVDLWQEAARLHALQLHQGFAGHQTGSGAAMPSCLRGLGEAGALQQQSPVFSEGRGL